MTADMLEALICEHGAALYRFCLKLTLSRDDADDLYQATFLKACERLHGIRENANPRGYLFAICINHWKTERRKYMSVHGKMVLVDLDDAALVDAGINVEDYVIAREQAQLISNAAAELNDKHRVPLYLYYTAELTIPEIAKALKIPEGTVKSRLYKARTAIQKRLGVSDYE